MKKFGMFLFCLGIVGLFYFTFLMDTSVKVKYPEGKLSGFPDRVNNLGLMNDKQNYMIFSGIVLIAGILILLLSKSNTEGNKNNSDNDHTLISKSFFCQKCGKELELSEEEIQNKRYICPECNSENLLS